jgi:hypothetical protein
MVKLLGQVRVRRAWTRSLTVRNGWVLLYSQLMHQSDGEVGFEG